MIPPWEIAILAITVLVAAAFSGGAFYAAGRRYQAQQMKDDIAARKARREAAETYATMQSTINATQATLKQMGERLEAVEDAREEDHAKIITLNQTIMTLTARIYYLEEGNAILLRQLEKLQQPPEWVPDGSVLVNVPVNLDNLETRLRKQFSMDEMADVALRIGLDPEDTPGGTISRRANELVAAARRRGLMDRLLMVCKELRPQTRW